MMRVGDDERKKARETDKVVNSGTTRKGGRGREVAFFGGKEMG